MKTIIGLFFFFSFQIQAATLHQAEVLFKTPSLVDQDLQQIYLLNGLPPETKTKHIDDLLKIKNFSFSLPVDDHPFDALTSMAQAHHWKKVTELTQELSTKCFKGADPINCSYHLKKIEQLIDQNDLDPIKVQHFDQLLKNAKKTIEVLALYQFDFIHSFDTRLLKINEESSVKSPPQSSIPSLEKPRFLLSKTVLIVGLIIFIALYLHRRLSYSKNQNSHFPLSRALSSNPDEIIKILSKLFDDHHLEFKLEEMALNRGNNDDFLLLSFPTENPLPDPLKEAQRLLESYSLKLKLEAFYTSKSISFALKLLIKNN